MKMDQVTDFNIIETVRDTAKFADKIDQLITAKKDMEKAKRDADDAVADFRRQKAAADNYINGRKAELAANQKEHDIAAAEAHARINVANAQMTEVLRIRAEVNAKQSELDGRDRNLQARERLMKDQQTQLAAKLHEIEVGQDLVRRQQAHIAAMPKS